MSQKSTKEGNNKKKEERKKNMTYGMACISRRVGAQYKKKKMAFECWKYITNHDVHKFEKTTTNKPFTMY